MPIDPARLYTGNMGSINPNAPPIFRASDFNFVGPSGSGLSESGQQIGSTQPSWTSNFGGMDTNNWRFYGGTEGNQDPNKFALQYKNAANGGMAYDYALDPTGQYYMPSNGRQAAMQGNTQYGSDFWVPALAIAGMGAAGAGLLGGGATGAAGGAAETSAAPAYGGVGSSLGSGAGAGLPLGSGSAAAGGAATGAGTTAGSGGSLLGNLTPTQAIQAGGLLAGAVGGNRGPQGQPVQRAPVYADPSQGGNQPYQSAPQIQPPQYGSANRPASQIWQQYAQGLFNPSYQPPSVPGVFGMTRGGYGGFLSPQMRPVGMPPHGLLQQPPMPNDPRIPQQLPPSGGGP